MFHFNHCGEVSSMFFKKISIVAVGVLTISAAVASSHSQLKDMPKDGRVIVYNHTNFAFKLQQSADTYQEPQSGVFGEDSVVQPDNKDGKSIFADIQPVTNPNIPYCTSDHPCVGVNILFKPVGYQVASPALGNYVYNTGGLIDSFAASPCEVMINNTPVFIYGWTAGGLTHDVVYTITTQDPGQLFCPLINRDV
jgi:hypothetical protein